MQGEGFEHQQLSISGTSGFKLIPINPRAGLLFQWSPIIEGNLVRIAAGGLLTLDDSVHQEHLCLTFNAR